MTVPPCLAASRGSFARLGQGLRLQTVQQTSQPLGDLLDPNKPVDRAWA